MVGVIREHGIPYLCIVDRLNSNIGLQALVACVLLGTFSESEGNGMLLGGLLFVIIEAERAGRLSEVVVEDSLLVDEVV